MEWWREKMKVGLFSTALVAATMGLVGAASAQTTTGTVTVTGSVGEKCTVTGGDSSTAFSDEFALGELADTDGTLATIPNQSTSGEGWRVHCTTAPDVSITATSLANVAPDPGAGYSNSVTYTAHADFSLVSGGPTTISAISGGGPTATTLAAHLSNSVDNVVIRANTFVDSGDVLVAGAYSGLITVTITP
jgi:type 1 fimbria pilin